MGHPQDARLGHPPYAYQEMGAVRVNEWGTPELKFRETVAFPR